MNYLLIDAGGSAIKYAMCNDDLILFDKGRIDNARSTKEEYYSKIKSIFDSMNVKADAVAISMAGMLDVKTGFCSASNILSDKDMAIAEDLSEMLGVPVTAINDGFAAALAELGYGNMQDADNGAVMVLGTGIGGGIIIDRKLYVGKGNAGNLSFILTNINEPFSFGNTFALRNGINGLKKAIFEKSGAGRYRRA